MAGFPIESLSRLACPSLAAAVDAASAAGAEVERCARALGPALQGSSVTERRRLRRRVRAGLPIDAHGDPALESLAAPYHRALEARERLASALRADYERDRTTISRRLAAFAAEDDFRHVLLLSSPGLEKDLAARRGDSDSQRRRREASWIAYLQRLTTKNDTISFFGPSTWGWTKRRAACAADIRLAKGLRRRVWFERWAAEGLAEVMASDPEAATLQRPVLDEGVLLTSDGAMLATSGEVVALDAAARECLAQCDGQHTVAELGGSSAVAPLVAAGLVRMRGPLPASWEPLVVLAREVSAWAAGPARDRWQARLALLESRRAHVEHATDVAGRRSALAAVADALVECGVAIRRESVGLAASRLPITEDCSREVERCEIGAPVLEQLEGDLAPWYELWRDLCGAYAAGLLRALQPVWRSCADRGVVRLAAFIAAVERAGIPLSRSGGIGAPRSLEAELQRAWHEQLGDRVGLPDVTLTPDDLGFVRRRFEVRRIRGFDWPAPDIQIAAAGADALAEGRWQLVVGELHPFHSPWHNGIVHACPDPQAMVADYMACGLPPVLEYARTSHYDGSVHTLVRAPAYLPIWTFTGPLAMDGVPRIRAAEVEVHLEDDDLVARDASGKMLGSFVDNWLVALSTHRLELLGTGAHTPRLCVGRVVVQRRTWVVDTSAEFPGRAPDRGLEAMCALRALRIRLGMPEQVFVRPLFQFRDSHHPDMKPLFVDFRNPLLVDLLASRIARYRLLRLAEALPSTDQFWLRDERGHYSCELRFWTRPAP
jgi:hypothetical protein